MVQGWNFSHLAFAMQEGCADPVVVSSRYPTGHLMVTVAPTAILVAAGKTSVLGGVGNGGQLTHIVICKKRRTRTDTRRFSGSMVLPKLKFEELNRTTKTALCC